MILQAGGRVLSRLFAKISSQRKKIPKFTVASPASKKVEPRFFAGAVGEVSDLQEFVGWIFCLRKLPGCCCGQFLSFKEVKMAKLSS